MSLEVLLPGVKCSLEGADPRPRPPCQPEPPEPVLSSPYALDAPLVAWQLDAVQPVAGQVCVPVVLARALPYDVLPNAVTPA